jgi:hypothetical protein
MNSLKCFRRSSISLGKSRVFSREFLACLIRIRVSSSAEGHFASNLLSSSDDDSLSDGSLGGSPPWKLSSSEELKLGFLAFLEDFFFLSPFEAFFFLGTDSSLLDGGSFGGGPLLLDCLATNGVAKGYVEGLVDGICPVGIAIDGMGAEVDEGGRSGGGL